MRNAVALPEGEDPSEWLAVHSTLVIHHQDMLIESPNDCYASAVDFFNEISIVYGTIGEFCTCESCPQMSAGPK